jgi:hypothetical protein
MALTAGFCEAVHPARHLYPHRQDARRSSLQAEIEQIPTISTLRRLHRLRLRPRNAGGNNMNVPRINVPVMEYAIVNT